MSDPDIKEETVEGGDAEIELAPPAADPVEDQAALAAPIATETSENPLDEQSEATENTAAEVNEEEGEEKKGTGEDVEDTKAYLKDQAKRRNKGDRQMIAEDFYYDYESLIFKPVVSDETKQAPDLLKIL